MATYSQIKPSFWTDPDVLESSPECKLIFVYLFTNKLCTVSGVYPITIRTISQETNYPEEIVKISLTKIKNVVYDFQNNVVFIKNRIRHYTGGNPELVKKGIKNDFCLTFKSPIWHQFLKEYPHYEKVILDGNMQLPLETDIITKPFNLSTFQPLKDTKDKVSKVEPLNNNNNNNNNNNINLYSLSNNDSPITLSKDNDDKSSEKLPKKYFNQLNESKNKIGILVTILKELHELPRDEEESDLYGRMGKIYNSLNKDSGYLLQIIWETATKPITGHHLEYIQSIIRNKKRQEKESSIKNSFVKTKGKSLQQVEQDEQKRASTNN